MKISWNYLNQFIDLSNINILSITEKLTLAGIEVEGTTYSQVHLDTILDIYLTTNRGDIQGIVNLATELSAILNKPIIINEKYKKPKVEGNLYIIKKVFNYQKKNHLIPHLQALNFKISHTILDPINFINLKWGQKFKAYEITLAIKNELLELSNDYEKYGKKLKNNQNNILKKLKEITETEKTNKEILIVNKRTLNRFSSYASEDLFQILDLKAEQILIPKTLIDTKEDHVNINSIIQCNIERITKILGPIKTDLFNPKLEKEVIINYLKRLNFQVENTNSDLRIIIPHERKYDIKNEIDIAEEIGRIHGFNNFIDTLPQFHKNDLYSPILKVRQKIRRNLRFNGLHEVISPSFQEKKLEVQYKIVNPLNQDQNLLRDNLVENLIKLTQNNIYKKNEPFEIFEIGTVFIKDKQNEKYQESQHLSCLMGNKSFSQLDWQTNSNSLTWFQSKGQIEHLFETLNAQILWSSTHDNNPFIKKMSKYIHPKKSVYIQHKNKTIGLFSQLNYRISHIMSSNYNMYFFEIDLKYLLESIMDKKHLNYRYSKYPEYPKTTRDLSIKTQKSMAMEQIQAIISQIEQDKTSMIESIKILNEYFTKEKIRTICFRVDYRSFIKTLTNTEVDILEYNLEHKITQILKSKA